MCQNLFNDPLDTEQILDEIRELRDIVVSIETMYLEDRKKNQPEIWIKNGEHDQ